MSPDSVTLKSFEILQLMAESSAKLCLRDTVIFDDVLVAINISEKYVRVISGHDSFSSPVEPKFKSVDDIDAYRDELEKWFLCFVRNILEMQI